MQLQASFSLWCSVNLECQCSFSIASYLAQSDAFQTGAVNSQAKRKKKQDKTTKPLTSMLLICLIAAKYFFPSFMGWRMFLKLYTFFWPSLKLGLRFHFVFGELFLNKVVFYPADMFWQNMLSSGARKDPTVLYHAAWKYHPPSFCVVGNPGFYLPDAIAYGGEVTQSVQFGAERRV